MNTPPSRSFNSSRRRAGGPARADRPRTCRAPDEVRNTRGEEQRPIEGQPSDCSPTPADGTAQAISLLTSSQPASATIELALTSVPFFGRGHRRIDPVRPSESSAFTITATASGHRRSIAPGLWLSGFTAFFRNRSGCCALSSLMAARIQRNGDWPGAAGGSIRPTPTGWYQDAITKPDQRRRYECRARRAMRKPLNLNFPVSSYHQTPDRPVARFPYLRSGMVPGLA